MFIKISYPFDEYPMLGLNRITWGLLSKYVCLWKMIFINMICNIIFDFAVEFVTHTDADFGV